jgi:hypothetical protein
VTSYNLKKDFSPQRHRGHGELQRRKRHAVDEKDKEKFPQMNTDKSG